LGTLLKEAAALFKPHLFLFAPAHITAHALLRVSYSREVHP